MASTGIDRWTGRPLSGFPHAAQCVEVIFSTRQGEMVMLEYFGLGLAELLGRRATLRTLDVYRVLIALGINTWEPRLNVVGVQANGNTTTALEAGELDYTVLCEYRPNALQGDYTVEGGLRQVGFGVASNGGITFRPIASNQAA